MKRRRAVIGLLIVTAVAAWQWRHHARRPEVARSPIGRVVRTAVTDPRTLPRATISGTITDETHAPVRSAQVCADLRSRGIPSQLAHEPRCAASDERGRYVLADLTPGEYAVAAAARPYRPGVYRPRGAGGNSLAVAAGERKLGIDIVLQGLGVEITGTVSDVTGGPIAHAWVSADHGWVGDAFTPPVESDASGTFFLWVAPGDVRVTARAAGYASGADDGSAPGTFEILLMPESSLSGTVVDASTGEPVAGVPVNVSLGDWYRFGEDRGTVDISDEHGAFHVAALEPGRYVASVYAPHAYGRSDGSTLVGLSEHVDGIVVKVHPAATVSGKVLRPDRTPCEHPSVAVSDSRTDTSATLVRGSDGTMHADGMLPGRYGVSVRCAGYVSHDRYPVIELRDHDITGLVWEVDAGAAIQGRVVTRSGAPIGGVYVSASMVSGAARAKDGWSSDTSSADGSFALAGLVPGRYRVEATASSHIGPTDGWLIDVAAGAQLTKQLVIEDGGSIKGIVVDAHDKPVGSVHVRALGAAERSARTNADGTFELDGLRPGDYTVVAMHAWWSGALRKPGSNDDDRQGDKVAVAAGRVARVKLVVEAQSGVIAGNILDASGRPVSDTFVSAARESDAAGAIGSSIAATRWTWDERPTVSSVDGTFRLTKLSPGTYTVRAFRRGGGEAIAEHVPVGGSAKLQIRSTGSIAGTVHRADPLHAFQISLADHRTGVSRHETFFRTGGAFAIRDLPKGAFVLAVTSDSGKQQLDIALGEGEHKTGVDITLDELVTLTGRVVDLVTKQPVPGMHMVAQLGTRSRDISIGDEDDDQAYISDDAGRFMIARAPRGAITLYGFDKDWDNGAYGEITTTRVIRGTGTIDIGELGAIKNRLGRSAVAGVLGVRFAEQPRDTPIDQYVFKVSFIDPRGPAAATELAVGDIVTAIDGIDVTGANHSYGFTLLRAPTGTTIKLGLARAATVTIVLAAP